jgi:hypothetical protein
VPRRRTLLSIVLAIVLASLVLLLVPGSQDSARDLDRRTVAPEPAQAPHALASGEIEDTREPALADPPPEVPPVAAPISWPRTITGSFLLSSKDGQAIEASSGRIVLAETSAGAPPGELYARVEHGRWILTVKREAELVPGRVDVGTAASARESLRATVEPTRFSSTVAEGPVIHAVLETGPTLHVLDQRTREDVSGLRLVVQDGRDPPPLLEGALPPAEFAVLGRDGSLASPYRFQPFVGTRTAWVKAEGTSWRRFAIGQEDVTVLLRPGADLGIVVASLGAGEKNAFVRVYAPELDGLPRRALAERLLRSAGTIELEGLPIGRVDVELQALGNRRPGGLRASQSVELVAGERASVSLDPGSAAAGLGRLELHVGPLVDGAMPVAKDLIVLIEDAADKTLSDCFYIKPEEVVLDGQGWSWHGPALVPGEYVVGLLQHGLMTKVTVRAGLTADVRLQFEPPSEVEVTVQREDGTVLAAQKLLVRSALARSPQAWREVDPRRESRTYRFRCPKGPIQVVYPTAGRQTGNQVFDVVGPQASFKLRVRGGKPVPLILAANDGERPVFLPLWYWSAIRIEPLDAKGGEVVDITHLAQNVAAYGLSDSTRASYSLSEPGRYRVTVPNWPGFVPDTTTEVDVGAEGASWSFPVARE